MSVMALSSVVWVALLTVLVAPHQLAGIAFVKGADAGIGQFPGVVSLQYNRHHLCGGSLVSQLWVLTAAHCLYEVNSECISVLLGSVNNTVGEMGTNVEIERYVIHPAYVDGSKSRPNDIGAIKLREEVQLSANILPVILQSRLELVPFNGIVVGWGQTLNMHDEVSPTLHYALLPVISRFHCQEIYAGYPKIDDSQFCAAESSGKPGQCLADSGGPFFMDGVQVGIVSWIRKPCTGEKSPVVFTHIRAHWRWIKTTTGVTPTRPSWDNIAPRAEFA